MACEWAAHNQFRLALVAASAHDRTSGKPYELRSDRRECDRPKPHASGGSDVSGGDQRLPWRHAGDSLHPHYDLKPSGIGAGLTANLLPELGAAAQLRLA